jgi:SAM-dependent methyltransferase
METSAEPFDVPARFHRGKPGTQKSNVDGAVELISRVAREIGASDLANTSVLDIGCGVRFTQAFFGRRVPMLRYHGVEVDREMVAFLSVNVNDPRFSYAHIDVYNARYNRKGVPFSPDLDIGAAGQTFDLVCLFSVFTHLAPDDFHHMLQLARRYVAETGTLIFTSFINDTIEGDFLDLDPAHPLLKAIYRESAVRAMAGATGWSVKKIFLGNKKQHWVICRPV